MELAGGESILCGGNIIIKGRIIKGRIIKGDTL
jgi:hypothetical protein